MQFFLRRIKVVLAGLIGSVIAAAANDGNDFIPGPCGRLSTVLQLPKDFDVSRDKCPLVIVMHGVMSHKNVPPMPRIARRLVRNGFAVLRFDFNSQGKSDGDVLKCTIPSEIDDARAVYDYVRSLPFVSSVVLLGHSQGGVVAGMLAGRLAREGRAPDALVLLAPGAVLKDYALEGRFLGVECDPVNPPEYVQVHWYKFSREYILTAQTLPIFEESAWYEGPVCIVHGTADKIVPVKYGRMYLDIWPSAGFSEIPGAGHLFTNRLGKVMAPVLGFLAERFPR